MPYLAGRLIDESYKPLEHLADLGVSGSYARRLESTADDHNKHRFGRAGKAAKQHDRVPDGGVATSVIRRESQAR